MRPLSVRRFRQMRRWYFVGILVCSGLAVVGYRQDDRVDQLLVAMAQAQHPSVTPERRARGMKSFSYPALGFQIMFPASWTVALKGELTVDNPNAPDVEGKSGGNATVSIFVEELNQLPSEMPLGQAVMNRIAGIKASAEIGSTTVSIKELRQLFFVGRPAYKTTWVERGDPRIPNPLQSTCYDFDFGRRRYVIATVVPEVDADKYADEIGDIVKSFKFISATALPPVAKERPVKWLAASRSALGITGDIKIAPDKITILNIDYPLTLVRDVDAQHLADVGKLLSEQPIAASLYRTKISKDAKLVHGSSLCGTRADANWMLAADTRDPYTGKPELVLTFFSGEGEPDLNYEAMNTSVGIL